MRTAAWLCLACAAACAPAGAPLPRWTLQAGGVALDVRVAGTADARRAGLQGVERLGPAEGMLFVYADDAPRRFWMRGCRLALDVAFLDARGRVLQVETLPPPTGRGDEVARTHLSPPARYALEVAAGFFERHGLGVGATIGLPAVAHGIAAER